MRQAATCLSMAIPLLLAVAGAAQAKDPDPKARAAAFQAVLDCRGIADNAQRLACFDAAAAKMGEAETKGEIVVIDRAQAAAAHREAFGLPVPSLSFLTRALRPEDVNRIEGVVESASADINGNWTFRLEGGAIWRQISGDLYRPPKHGSKVAIRRGSLDSYLMNVDGQPSIKVHRDQ
ncbi:hypothetical protein [Phenylobacterium sp.]|uniref:hypothetical protein n=1 Tax=Phenylobacterium sp. TaxID=1871053 RepID=UPI00261DB33F|nr:hypothetical protein [Phenylobacterium sp.]